ncbi:MAG: LysR substrate-binding domain-containing protein [Pseudomonadota bacterium]
MSPTATPPILSPAARLDLDAMRALVAVAEAETVTLAANRLGRTPAAISMQVKKLEDLLGTALFVRSRSGMALTRQGERLMPYARRMIEAERAAREAFARAPLEGRVHIGLIDDVSDLALSQMLAAFARSHREVTVDVTVASTATLAPMLDRGELDLALFTPGACTPWRADDRLIVEEPLVWAVSHGDVAPWRERPLPLALATEGCAWRRLTLEALHRADIPYRIACQSDVTAALTAAVLGGMAVTVAPASQLPPGVRALGPADGAPALGTARIGLRLGTMPSAAARALAERVAEVFCCHLATAPTPPPEALEPCACA